MTEKKSTALGEFKDFILKGNVIDLAVAVIVATFFGKIVTDLVDLILTLFAIPGKHGQPFSGLTFKIGGGVFHYGQLIDDVIAFVVVAAVVFFAVVRPVHKLMEMRRSAPDPESTDRACPYCLSDIPKAATRCAYCTAEVTAVA